MIGVTELPGIDDFGPDETFSEADATSVLNWAKPTVDAEGLHSGSRVEPG